MDQIYENMGNKQHLGIPIEELATEIERKKAAKEFDSEYKAFPSGKQFPCTEGEKPENKSRNRFLTTFPYDHSRVTLPEGQDYINANFIQSLEKDNAYVATQGPKKNTLDDFWTMIWQLQSGKIVMLANCIEVGKNKVEKYWPDARMTVTYSGLNISHVSTKEYAAYSVRKLKVENEKTKEARFLSQYHLTKWPDHGTPDVMHFALFLLNVVSDTSKLTGPMIVHCSAGIGRTGTFIALDALFRNGKETGFVDPPKYVKTMRKDRMNMVQTVDQYKCIYKAMVELFLIDNTDLSIEDFGPDCLESYRLQAEYQKLDDQRPTIDEDELEDGMMEKNQSKNRDPEILPGKKHRPLLSSHPANKTDYINAVFLPSVKQFQAYIATQLPLPDTSVDFWAMMYDYRCTTVVLLDSDSDASDPILMPTKEKEQLPTGNFVIQSLTSLAREKHFSTVEVALNKKGDSESNKVTFFQINDWPLEWKTCPKGSITQIVYAVQGRQRDLSSPGLTVVVCRNGSTKCGVFCSVANAIENINLHQRFSMIQVVRQLQNRRPSFINTFESYKICNQAVKEHFDTLSEYGNFSGHM